MKLGTDSPVKTALAIVFAIVAVLLIVRTYFSSTGEAAPVTTTTNSPRPVKQGNTKPVSSLDPTLRTDLLKAAEGTKYEGKGRNIFTEFVEIPQPKQEVMRAPEPAPQMQVPQGPPPIDMKFIGFASKSGERKQIFLMQNEDVFVAKEGDIVNRRYKIVKINANSVEIEDVLNNNHQSIPLTQG